jgi:peroxiredoxin family protein
MEALAEKSPSGLTDTQTRPVHPTPLEENKRLSLICFSGDFDKLVATFTLASGAAAVGYEVSVFFTFWGLNVIRTAKGRRPIGKGFLARLFNFLQGGAKKVPLSRLNFAGLSPRLMTYMMKKRNVATLPELIDASIALGVNLYACEMSMNILGTEHSDFIPEVKEVIGVATFLQYSSGGERIFI